jgi:hypothetical protein
LVLPAPKITITMLGLGNRCDRHPPNRIYQDETGCMRPEMAPIAEPRPQAPSPPHPKFVMANTATLRSNRI